MYGQVQLLASASFPLQPVNLVCRQTYQENIETRINAVNLVIKTRQLPYKKLPCKNLE